MQLPENLRAILAALRRAGRPRLVGGCVRDWLLGLDTKDYDVEVAGLDFDTMHRILAPFGATDVVGRSFGVIKLNLGERTLDFCLPRRESKTGAGHRGFAVAPDPTLSDAEAAARRDFTVNAIGYDPFTNQLIDPLGGQADLVARRLRHAGPGFADDPLRVLRAVQLAARFDLQLAPETAALARSISDTFIELPVERIWSEWEKWATRSLRPSRGLEVLEQAGWLRHFPEIAALRGTPQEPEWHPEGDVFTHTQYCLDALAGLPDWRSAGAARRRLLLFGVLAHDFGKPSTTAHAERHGVLRWISPGHESAGGPLAESFLRRIGAPLDLTPPVVALVVSHLVHHHGPSADYSDSQVRRLARRLDPATIDDLTLVMTADSLGRPPLQSPETLERISRLKSRAAALELEKSAPRPLIQGRNLIALGFKPGPTFGPILDRAFEAQLDGEFTDAAGAQVWLKRQIETAGPA